MNIRFSAPLLLFVLVTFLAMPKGAIPANLVERVEGGQVDWTNRVIEATGINHCPDKKANEAQARSLARHRAIETARENLLAIIKRIPIDSDKLVSDMLDNDQQRAEALRPYIKKAEVADISYDSKRKVRVTLSLRMDGKVADILLPAYIKTIEPIMQKISSNNNGCKKYTGIVIDCRGIGFRPCLIPRIVNEKNEEIFGPAYVSRECVINGGMVKYVSGPDSRVKNLWLGPKPLVLKALRLIKEKPTVVVVTNADGEILRGDPNNLELFHDCKVVFILE
ncbi:MAG: hypothetical protein DRH15_03765 [Deltaproteobacteria bacterium]|nr:MAG: hypothetical protein DRH15_03765 [Deltaproteobacteria bacterium]